VSEGTVSINITYTGPVVLTMLIDCPVPDVLNIIEVVVTSDTDAGKTIHSQFRYTNGTFVGPLQSNGVVFQSGLDTPLVSRYNVTSGFVGTGSFPPDGSDVILQTNKIAPDNYVFNSLGNKFRYLRSSTLYLNNPTDILNLLLASSVASPITGGGNLFEAQFAVPSSTFGEYLYLIWDLRQTGIFGLCYTDDGSEESLTSLCCDCLICQDECFEIEITNLSATETAGIYLPGGLCGSGVPVSLTLDPEEVVKNLCIVNAEYYVAFGDVDIEFIKCNCS
jgi:hypothetical protein